ncbi:MAG: hypothetical protein ACFHWZ_04195 [Phycisphaerales bacterium]
MATTRGLPGAGVLHLAIDQLVEALAHGHRRDQEFVVVAVQ